MTKETLFRCPNCHQALIRGEKQYYCSGGHTFDLARKGYVNLLLPSHTRSREPGDSKQMLQSRRAFLNKGYYQPFSDVLNETVLRTLQRERLALLDAGCGEGYYLARLASCLRENLSEKAELYGIDISKRAINYAASRDRNLQLAVGSSYHLPIVNESLDYLLCIFAPRHEGEFARVLKPKGLLLVAAPGPYHLFSFRQVLYKDPPPIGERGTVGEGFKLLAERHVSYEVELRQKEDLLHLFRMTPYCRHAEGTEFERIEALQIEVDFKLLVYQKI